MTDTSRQEKPIFIHSLFRSGSTYLFNVFRRSDAGYWCYQEPFNDHLLNLDDHPEKLLEPGSGLSRELRHPRLDRPYFWEYHEIRSSLAGRFRPEFIYRDFFVPPGEPLDDAQRVYLQALLDQAKGRPVLQFCRSFGRCRAMQKAFDSLDIHLWREPAAQWWSIKINAYFEAAILKIYDSPVLPDVLGEVRQQAGLSGRHEETPEGPAAPATTIHDGEAGYRAFFALWLFSFLECGDVAEVEICIDRLSGDGSYRDEVLSRLNELGVGGVDFSDCSIPVLTLSSAEREWFQRLETQVADVFVRHGTDPERLEAARERIESLRDTATESGSSAGDNPGARARAVALRFMEEFGRAARVLEEGQARLHEVDEWAGSLQRSNNQLEGRLDEVRKQAQRFEGEIKELSGATGALEALRDKADEERGRAELERRQIREEIGSLRGRFDQVVESEKALEMELRALHEHSKRLEEEKHGLSVECSELQDGLTEARQQADLLEQECAQLREDNSTLTQKNGVLKDQVAKSHAARKTAESGVSAEKRRNAALAADLAATRNELSAVYSSKSWRLMRPGRAVWGLIRRFILLVRRGLKALVKKPVLALMRWMLRRPGLSRPISRLLDRWPGLKSRLIGVALHQRMMPATAPMPAADASRPREQPRDDRAGRDSTRAPAWLTPEAARIFHRLSDARREHEEQE